MHYFKYIMILKRPILNMFVDVLPKFSSIASANMETASMNLYTNPCVKLCDCLEIPLLNENEKFFSPDIEAMVAAQNLFLPKPGHEVRAISRTINQEHFPDHDLPEVIIIGRSNAGKSSLLKAIFQYVPDIRIRTSKKPGHTKGAHFFRVGSNLCLVDMPGYGENQPQWFAHCVEGYLKSRKNLVRALFLIDSEAGFHSWDEYALDMLEGFRTPYALIMTKIDKAPEGRLLRNLIHMKQIKDKYMSLCCFPQPFLVSSITYEGLAHLLAFIAHITGNLKVE